MDLLLRIKSIDCLIKFLRGELDKICVWDYCPEKTEILKDENPVSPLPRSVPEQQGVRSEFLYRFINTLAQQTDCGMHSLMVLRHGFVIAEGYWAPYRPEYPQMMYSFSKSLVSTAVGMAISEGYFDLNDKLSDIFPDKRNPVFPKAQKDITIKNLLTMSAGVAFNESGTVLEQDWVKAFMESHCSFEPGSEFFYNSMNSYMLSAVISQKTGQNVFEFLRPRLWEPLGIRTATWESCPCGCNKGGWGLNLTLEDMAKIGQLHLQNGVWEAGGRKLQLIPEDWIKQATSSQIDKEGTGYGFHIWQSFIPGAYQFLGAYGQGVLVLPGLDMVVAYTADGGDLFDTGYIPETLNRFFSDKSVFYPKRLRKNKKDFEALQFLLQNLRIVEKPMEQAHIKKRSFWQKSVPTPESEPEEIPKSALAANGTRYSFQKSFAGLMPLTLQAVHENFTTGITEISLQFEKEHCLITIAEGNDTNTIRAGYQGKYEYSPVTLRDERFMVGASGTWDEADDELHFFVKAAFIETPHIRLMDFMFRGSELKVIFDELPGALRSVHLFSNMVGGTGSESLDNMLAQAVKRERLIGVVRSLIRPEIESIHPTGKEEQ